jgi:hypothetical protein
MVTLSLILKNTREIPSFPIGLMQDFFQNLFKICKNIQDVPVRLVVINSMRLAIKTGFVINQQNTNEFVKLMLRYIAVKALSLNLFIGKK